MNKPLYNPEFRIHADHLTICILLSTVFDSLFFLADIRLCFSTWQPFLGMSTTSMDARCLSSIYGSFRALQGVTKQLLLTPPATPWPGNLRNIANKGHACKQSYRLFTIWLHNLTFQLPHGACCHQKVACQETSLTILHAPVVQLLLVINLQRCLLRLRSPYDNLCWQSGLACIALQKGGCWFVTFSTILKTLAF